MKRHTFIGKTIFEIPNILSDEDCDNAKKIIDDQKENQSIMRDNLLSEKWWEILRTRLPAEIEHSDGKKYKIIGLGEEITMSKNMSAIGIHLDRQTDIFNLYKLAIYVNKVSKDGGTIFCNRSDSKRFGIEPEIGKAIMFDISLHHYGASIPANEKKYMIGFRIICEPL